MPPKYLAFTDEPGFSGDPAETLSLAPPRQNQAGANSSPYAQLLGDPSSWLKVYNRSLASRDMLVAKTAEWLDTYHGIDKGRLYWEQVIGWFANYYCDAMTLRLAILELVQAKYPHVQAVGMDTAAFARPSGCRDFEASLVNCPWSNLQLWTRAAIGLGFEMQLNQVPSSARAFSYEKTHAPTGNIAPGRLWPMAGRSDIWFYKTLIQRRVILKLALSSGLRIADIPEIADPVERETTDAETRAALADIPVDTLADKVLMQGFAELLPSAALENWADLNARAEDWIGKRQPRVIVTGVGMRWNTQFAVWAAECQRRGTRIVGTQHGGSYGERAYHETCETHERRVSDVFATWGWQEDEKTVPLPAPRLAGLRQRRKPVSDGPILWIGTSDSRHVYQMGPRPVGSQFLNYFDEQRAFSKALSPDIAKDVLFRCYPREFGWIGQPGRDGALPVQIDDFQTSLHARLAAARLAVVDHVGSTTILEALAAGCPVLCFGTRQSFDIRESARPFYDALEKTGVFHQSVESAAAMVNEIAGDVPGWWQEPARQDAVRQFSDNFALKGRFLSQWRNFLFETRHRGRP